MDGKSTGANESPLACRPAVMAVVGHDGSRASLAAAPVYNDAGIAQIVPTSTPRLLRRAGPWTFPVADDDSVEGALLADFAVRRLHARGITIFYHNDEYGLGLRDGVQAGLDRLAVPVLDEVRYDTWSDLETLVEASLARAPADVIVVAGRQHETARIARLVTARRPGTPIVAGDGALVLPALANEAGPAISAIYVAAFWLPDSSARSMAFVARFRRVAGRDPDPFDAMTHDALMLAATAIRTVGADRRAVRDYLASLGRSRPPYAGITGAVEFGVDRPARTVMAKVVNGRAVRVAS